MASRLIKTRFAKGVWQGVLYDTPDGDGLKVWRDGKRVDGLQVTPASDATWDVRFQIPQDALGDTAAVFLFRVPGQVAPVMTLTLLAGKALADDPRAELAALRAEVELLKTVLRRGLANNGLPPLDQTADEIDTDK